jgi:hypothetical protein
MYCPYAFAQRAEQRFTPAERRERRGLLIRLFIGGGEESHSQRVAIYVFPHGDDEFEVSVRLVFLYREEMKLREFLRGIRLREGPI